MFFRGTRHAGHCWRSWDELISDILLWTPSHGRAKAGRTAGTYIQQLCAETRCGLEDLPEAMDDNEGWQERVKEICANSATWWGWWLYRCFCRRPYGVNVIVLLLFFLLLLLPLVIIVVLFVILDDDDDALLMAASLELLFLFFCCCWCCSITLCLCCCCFLLVVVLLLLLYSLLLLLLMFHFFLIPFFRWYYVMLWLKRWTVESY